MNEKIANIRNFVNANRLYMWLVIFIIMVNVAAMCTDESRETTPEKKLNLFPSAGELVEKRADLESRLIENKKLSSLLGLAIVLTALVVLAGIMLNIVIMVLKIGKKELILKTLTASRVNWTIWDAVKIIILFLFFGYLLAIIEAILARPYPSIGKEETLRAAFNTTLLDLLGASFVLYFALGRYRQNLADLGVSFRNFFKNVFYGLAGYIAAVPALLVVLLTITWLAAVFNYEPPPQEVLELLVGEKKIPALLYLSLFVGIFGPIAEELFFRGFMYSAIKKEMGASWALFLSSLLFSIFHVHLVGFIPIMMLGLLLGYLYEKTGSLVASVTVHIVHNSAMLFFVFLMKELYF